MESLPPYEEKKGRVKESRMIEVSGNKGCAKWSHFWVVADRDYLFNPKNLPEHATTRNNRRSNQRPRQDQ